MVSKYIKRDFTDHVQTTQYISDEDEYVKFEIFSFDPVATQTYVADNGSLTGENVNKVNFRGWQCCQAKDKINPMEFTLPYVVKEAGDYRVDILYEKNGKMYSSKGDKLYNTSDDLTGWYDFYSVSEHSEHKAKIVTPADINKNTPKAVKKAMEKAVENANKNLISKPDDGTPLTFEGVNNAIKRKTIYLDSVAADSYKFEFAVPHNCYVYGAIIRKVIRFWGTNNDEPGTNLQFTEATLTISDMGKPTELKCTIGYDNSFECEGTRSGLYMEYMDECNFYVRNNEGDIVRKFGGYVSTPLPDNDRKTLNIHCADRLKDGENKYILDQLELQHGDGSDKDHEETISFDKYAELLDYLCTMYESTLNNNIDGNYHVEGEKYNKSFDITFGKKKKIKKISVTNGQSVVNNSSITLRNNSSGKKKQIFRLYNPKQPVNISQYESVDDNGKPMGLNFHIVYGLGNTKTANKKKETATVDIGNSVAGSQKFSKCGVSQDKKYVMAIGTVSSAKDSGHYGTYYKTVFKNKCPHCGEAKLVWDSCRSDTKCVYTMGWAGSKAKWGVPSNETEITCNGCDSDFSALGNEKDSPWKKLTKVGSTVKSSKAEQTKLHKGNMVALPSGKETEVSAEDIFKAIKNACKGWRHELGTGTTAAYLEKHHVGDCGAWSDWISKQLKKYKVNHKIKEYVTSGSNQHRSVLYQNSQGKYVDFPYREYDFPKNTRNTDASLSGNTYYHYKSGGRISQAVTGGKTSKTQTTEVTITNGYDKDAPFQAYLDIVISFDKKKKYHVYMDFTQKAISDNTISGLKPVWVNNASKKLTFVGFKDRIYDYFGHTNETIYLHSISFVTPVIKTTNEDKKANWYTVDKATQDNSSCKMALYSIAFNSEGGTQPGPLDSSGKTVNDLLKSTLEDADYIAEIEYAEHRCNDKIYFKVNNKNTAAFTATEGDSNNILEWSNISYNPANELFNMSRCVFKKNKTDKYYYVESKDAISILKYQEQCTLQTESEPIGEKEAYWNARHNEKFNSEQTYSYTITVGGSPDVDLKDLVNVVANKYQLNTLKEVESITLTYNHKTKPVVQTQLGLGELAPDIQLKKNIKQLRDNAKTNRTDFIGSATPIENNDIYTWEY